MIRNGHRAAVLLGADDYDALEETLAVLADQDLLRDHLSGMAESAEDLRAAMAAVGRLPATSLQRRAAGAAAGRQAVRSPLEPALSARRGPYRVLYVIDERARTVTVTSTSHRTDVYRT